ncbi:MULTISPECIES: hypothetical protein [Streptomyces]|uniref:hypothetical protein n=1 Tax=Streptomyces TaxID=1883 RepID=UPI00226F165F|nr:MULTISPECIES: hypothetical protein [unclassified Streptomyces]MCY0942240.1 hypothetical protein [Streptomyces sp. H34-AA3]MCY0951864.1 hypothetical protein [Streptomyces sp. H27-S2]MCZ4083220.1 hypothetical protein [Streptomyces sp. H34-S5]
MTLRVLFALLPILSCGFLAWGSMLRLALVTRKTRDWVLLVVSGGLVVLWMTLIGLDPTAETNGWQGNLGAGGSIFTGFAICVYFLVADIKHFEAKAADRSAHWYGSQPAPYLPPHLPQQQQSQGYGYPHQQPAPRTTQPQHPAQPQQPPHATPPPRIGQVRAELDELSELLRNQPPRDEDPTR